MFVPKVVTSSKIVSSKTRSAIAISLIVLCFSQGAWARDTSDETSEPAVSFSDIPGLKDSLSALESGLRARFSAQMFRPLAMQLSATDAELYEQWREASRLVRHASVQGWKLRYSGHLFRVAGALAGVFFAIHAADLHGLKGHSLSLWMERVTYLCAVSAMPGSILMAHIAYEKDIQPSLTEETDNATHAAAASLLSLQAAVEAFSNRQKTAVSASHRKQQHVFPSLRSFSDRARSLVGRAAAAVPSFRTYYR